MLLLWLVLLSLRTQNVHCILCLIGVSLLALSVVSPMSGSLITTTSTRCTSWRVSIMICRDVAVIHSHSSMLSTMSLSSTLSNLLSWRLSLLISVLICCTSRDCSRVLRLYHVPTTLRLTYLTPLIWVSSSSLLPQIGVRRTQLLLRILRS